MNWVQLHSSEVWHEFFRSPEMVAKKNAMYQQLVHAALDPETRGMIRGQIKMVESLESFVEGLARHQQQVETADLVPHEEPRRGWKSLLPQIY